MSVFAVNPAHELKKSAVLPGGSIVDDFKLSEYKN